VGDLIRVLFADGCGAGESLHKIQCGALPVNNRLLAAAFWPSSTYQMI
jgi:hypothetical protein